MERSPPKKGARLGSAELAIGSPNERKLRKYQVAEYKTSRKAAARPERLSNVSEYTPCGAIAHFIYITLIHTYTIQLKQYTFNLFFEFFFWIFMQRGLCSVCEVVLNKETVVRRSEAQEAYYTISLVDYSQKWTFYFNRIAFDLSSCEISVMSL